MCSIKKKWVTEIDSYKYIHQTYFDKGAITIYGGIRIFVSINSAETIGHQ